MAGAAHSSAAQAHGGGGLGHIHIGDVPVLADPMAIAAAAAALGAAAVLAAGRRAKPEAQPVRVDDDERRAEAERGRTR